MTNPTAQTMTQARDRFHADKRHSEETDILQYPAYTLTVFYCADSKMITWQNSNLSWCREVFVNDIRLSREVFV